jgi:predicted DNA-binding ribbon-helix-helix protein
MRCPAKRSIVILGHRTSISLEDAFWDGLKEIASRQKVTVSHLIASIDPEHQHANLSSAIRLFVLSFYQLNARNAQPGVQYEQRELLKVG